MLVYCGLLFLLVVDCCFWTYVGVAACFAGLGLG